MTTTGWFSLVALLPIVVVLGTMVGLRWSGAKAGAAGWGVAMLLALTLFRASPELLLYAHLRSVLLSLYVLYIIWTALALYYVVNEAQAIQDISAGVARLTGDKLVQLLILSWIFASFLQGITGFGVPVAIVTPLLVGLGFNPLMSVVATGIAHSWAVTFGSAGSSFYTLMAVTGLPGEQLESQAALLLGTMALLCGACVAHLYGSWRGVTRGLPFIVGAGVTMAGTQYLLAISGFWAIASFGAGLAGLIIAIPLARLPFYRGTTAQSVRVELGAGNDSSKVPPPQALSDEQLAALRGGTSISTDPAPGRAKEAAPAPAPTPSPSPNTGGGEQKGGAEAGWRQRLLVSLSAYGLLLLIVLLAGAVPPLKELLNRVQLNYTFPTVTTGLGWTVEGGPGRSVSLFGHAGALIGYASILSFFIYRAAGRYQAGTGQRILRQTLKRSRKSTLSILTLVAMALVMDNSGQVFAIADGLRHLLPTALYPLAAPFIGTLGAFMTGSNTNSNVIFAGLQQQVAQLLALSVPAILAAQTTGGALGSMIAPAKIIVGASTVNIAGREGEVLRATWPYALLLLLATGGLTYLLL